MREIDIYLADDEILQTKSFTFSGGEIQVSIPDMLRWLEGDICVVARLQDAASIVQLDILADLIQKYHVAHTGVRTLVVPYMPYARQDRRMARNEAFSLRRIANIINGLGFDRVQVCDPHSDVTPALIQNCEVVTQLDLLKNAWKEFGPDEVIVAPDAGAQKKALAVAKHFNVPVVTASKIRDMTTGEITGTKLDDPSTVNGKWVTICDDICDGGRTFIELAKVLREAGAYKVGLSVTHGIFSKGLAVFDDLIDEIDVTDSFLSPHIEGPNLYGATMFVQKLFFNERGIVL